MSISKALQSLCSTATAATKASAISLVCASAVVLCEHEPAAAIVVNVGGQDWDVTTFTGSYSDNVSKFETAANGGVMPWWNSLSLAIEFGDAAFGNDGLGLGLPNSIPYSPSILIGPYFAAGFIREGGNNDGLEFFARRPGSGFVKSIGSTNWGGSLDSDYTWAQASLITTQAVPGPLPILGAFAAFGFSRKLRKRIKASKLPASTVVS